VTVLAKGLALAAILYMVKLLLYPLFKPVSGRQKKRVREYAQAKKQAALGQRLHGLKLFFADNYVAQIMARTQRSRYAKMIDRLDLQKSPQELMTEQILYALAAALLSLLALRINPVLGLLSSLLIALGWMYPVDALEKLVDKKNKAIALDFPSFYSMVYYQYARSVHIFLADVVKDYLPNANPDMAEELGVLLDNIAYGDEEYGLKQLKRRVPLHYIIRFCDIMETRLKGYDNVSQMQYLKNEVDVFRVRALEEELERRKRGSDGLQLVLLGVLVMYIVIYYGFTVMDALKMFQ
jgi:hypothetical protein